jgi:methyl-accepting chemotaxis protein
MARKVIGYTFIVAAVLGLLFSMAGIVLVWTVKAPLTANMFSTLDLIDTTLEATSAGFTIVDDTLANTISDLNSIENTVQTAGNGIDDSVPMVQSLSTLLSENIPQAITATQAGLSTLQDAAGTVESTLQLLTSIPFLPIEGYDPEVSFSAALEDVSQSLDAIPESLSEMETTMNTTEGNLVMLGAQVNIIARNISELKDSFYQIQLVFDQYQEVIEDVQGRIDTFRGNLQTGITVTAWIFTFIFIWLGIAQLALLTQGLERVDFSSIESSSGSSDISDDTSIPDAPENADSNSEPADD